MYSVYVYSTLLKIVSYYDLSVLSTSVTGFQKSLDLALSSYIFDFFNMFFLTSQSP